MTVAELQPGYEEVFTVMDYYDGPRKGVANFRGQPHFYDCIFLNGGFWGFLGSTQIPVSL